ncbi:hypothetical protein [Halalkalibacter sp. APA_J-10(15)]|uniref:hypothetical protein n=1 Tax=unclassified Halalkalibacter TaxID=2893063 RepID=UPI001FF2A81A|nr:hypothetical protein [Halalkalibacter sp. APA_J-10(15)]MCK0471487.1 hypothetical protein [Halalkalibacter sp. APA_J-10(15)]
MKEEMIEQELVDVFVKKVMKKHSFQKINNKADKKALKDLVTKLQNQVEEFIENQEKTFTESEANETKNTVENPSNKINIVNQIQDNKKMVESKNDLKQVKIFKKKR